MNHVRIEHDGRALEGTLEGETVRAGGVELAVDHVQRWLSPVTPSKILATHLTYRSRAEEYKMARMPSEPSYFMKPPSSLSGHLAPVYRPPGCRFLNYEGEVAVVIGRRCHRVSVDDALDYVGGYTVVERLGRPRLPSRRPRLDAPRQGAGRVLPARPGDGRRRRRRPG